MKREPRCPPKAVAQLLTPRMGADAGHAPSRHNDGAWLRFFGVTRPYAGVSWASRRIMTPEILDQRIGDGTDDCPELPIQRVTFMLNSS
jgi:hypothetical protein